MTRWRIPGWGRLLSALDDLRGSYWFLPSVMAVAGALLAVATIAADRVLRDAVVRDLAWLTQSDPDGTRAVLSVIAGSMITVTGVIFSVTVVSLTLASSQFGPRLLRNFLRDRTNQLAFGTFVATFLYSLIVLRSVRADAVPHLSSAVAVLLATGSLFVLIYFIHHTASIIQASSVIAAVADEIDVQLDALFPERLGEGLRDDETAVRRVTERLEEDSRAVTAGRDGFIRVVDDQALMRLVVERDLVLALDQRPGDFVFRGLRLARVGPASRVTDELAAALAHAVVIGDIRSAVQDLGFPVGQLTEIAVRALSPGVNDPRTAIDCTRRLGALLAAVAGRAMPSRARADEAGTLRVLAPATTFDEIVSVCLDPIRCYAGDHASVVVALLDVVGAAGRDTDAVRRATLVRHLDEIRTQYHAGEPRSERDRTQVDEAWRRARQALEPKDDAAGARRGDRA